MQMFVFSQNVSTCLQCGFILDVPDELSVTLMKKEYVSQPHMPSLHVCTHTTNQCENFSPHLISSGLSNMQCLPYLQKGQVQNGSPGTLN